MNGCDEPPSCFTSLWILLVSPADSSCPVARNLGLNLSYKPPGSSDLFHEEKWILQSLAQRGKGKDHSILKFLFYQHTHKMCCPHLRSSFIYKIEFLLFRKQWEVSFWEVILKHCFLIINRVFKCAWEKPVSQTVFFSQHFILIFLLTTYQFEHWIVRYLLNWLRVKS